MVQAISRHNEIARFFYLVGVDCVGVTSVDPNIHAADSLASPHLL